MHYMTVVSLEKSDEPKLFTIIFIIRTKLETTIHPPPSILHIFNKLLIL